MQLILSAAVLVATVSAASAQQPDFGQIARDYLECQSHRLTTTQRVGTRQGVISAVIPAPGYATGWEACDRVDAAYNTGLPVWQAQQEQEALKTRSAEPSADLAARLGGYAK